ncbi:hypothetical protein GCM10023176_34490 [Micromonospora coerulea]|uniref:Uncharacterized protein n=1 Tax=Micromonospora coerulea TaxID=47856 RepID=A0ABP8SQE1_9ACTN
MDPSNESRDRQRDRALSGEARSTGRIVKTAPAGSATTGRRIARSRSRRRRSGGRCTGRLGLILKHGLALSTGKTWSYGGWSASRWRVGRWRERIECGMPEVKFSTSGQVPRSATAVMVNSPA